MLFILTIRYIHWPLFVDSTTTLLFGILMITIHSTFTTITWFVVTICSIPYRSWHLEVPLPGISRYGDFDHIPDDRPHHSVLFILPFVVHYDGLHLFYHPAGILPFVDLFIGDSFCSDFHTLLFCCGDHLFCCCSDDSPLHSTDVHLPFTHLHLSPLILHCWVMMTCSTIHFCSPFILFSFIPYSPVFVIHSVFVVVDHSTFIPLSTIVVVVVLLLHLLWYILRPSYLVFIPVLILHLFICWCDDSSLPFTTVVRCLIRYDRCYYTTVVDAITYRSGVLFDTVTCSTFIHHLLSVFISPIHSHLLTTTLILPSPFTLPLIQVTAFLRSLQVRWPHSYVTLPVIHLHSIRFLLFHWPIDALFYDRPLFLRYDSVRFVHHSVRWFLIIPCHTTVCLPIQYSIVPTVVRYRCLLLLFWFGILTYSPLIHYSVFYSRYSFIDLMLIYLLLTVFPFIRWLFPDPSFWPHCSITLLFGIILLLIFWWSWSLSPFVRCIYSFPIVGTTPPFHCCCCYSLMTIHSWLFTFYCISDTLHYRAPMFRLFLRYSIPTVHSFYDTVVLFWPVLLRCWVFLRTTIYRCVRCSIRPTFDDTLHSTFVRHSYHSVDTTCSHVVRWVGISVLLLFTFTYVHIRYHWHFLVTLFVVLAGRAICWYDLLTYVVVVFYVTIDTRYIHYHLFPTFDTHTILLFITFYRWYSPRCSIPVPVRCSFYFDPTFTTFYSLCRFRFRCYSWWWRYVFFGTFGIRCSVYCWYSHCSGDSYILHSTFVHSTDFTVSFVVDVVGLGCLTICYCSWPTLRSCLVFIPTPIDDDYILIHLIRYHSLLRSIRFTFLPSILPFSVWYIHTSDDVLIRLRFCWLSTIRFYGIRCWPVLYRYIYHRCCYICSFISHWCWWYHCSTDGLFHLFIPFCSTILGVPFPILHSPIHSISTIRYIYSTDDAIHSIHSLIPTTVHWYIWYIWLLFSIRYDTFWWWYRYKHYSSICYSLSLTFYLHSFSIRYIYIPFYTDAFYRSFIVQFWLLFICPRYRYSTWYIVVILMIQLFILRYIVHFNSLPAIPSTDTYNSCSYLRVVHLIHHWYISFIYFTYILILFTTTNCSGHSDDSVFYSVLTWCSCGNSCSTTFPHFDTFIHSGPTFYIVILSNSPHSHCSFWPMISMFISLIHLMMLPIRWYIHRFTLFYWSHSRWPYHHIRWNKKFLICSVTFDRYSIYRWYRPIDVHTTFRPTTDTFVTDTIPLILLSHLFLMFDTITFYHSMRSFRSHYFFPFRYIVLHCSIVLHSIPTVLWWWPFPITCSVDTVIHRYLIYLLPFYIPFPIVTQFYRPTCSLIRWYYITFLLHCCYSIVLMFDTFSFHSFVHLTFHWWYVDLFPVFPTFRCSISLMLLTIRLYHHSIPHSFPHSVIYLRPTFWSDGDSLHYIHCW